MDLKLIGKGRTADIYTWENGVVLKLFHKNFSPEWIEREAKITKAVYALGIPSPQTGEIITHHDRKGILYENLQGKTMLRAIMDDPGAVSDLAREFGKLHAHIHSKKLPDLPPLKIFLIDRISSVTQLEQSIREKLLAHLESLPDGNSVLHTDYHPDNIIMTSRGSVAIDWLTGSSGNPFADVARTSLMLRYGSLPPGTNPFLGVLLLYGKSKFQNSYFKTYSELAHYNQDEVNAWLPIMAAARLAENLPMREKKRLASIVNKWVNKN